MAEFPAELGQRFDPQSSLARDTDSRLSRASGGGLGSSITCFVSAHRRLGEGARDHDDEGRIESSSREKEREDGNKRSIALIGISCGTEREAKAEEEAVSETNVHFAS